MHIGSRGASKGKFVPCVAKVQPCKIKGTTHLNSDTVDLIKANYGEATYASYISYLRDRLAGTEFIQPVPSKRGRKPKAKVARAVFEKNIVYSFATQEELNNLLETGGVRATTENVSWNGEAYLPDGTMRNRYDVDNVNTEIADFGVTTPFTNPKTVLTVMNKTLRELKQQNKRYSLYSPTLKNLTKVAVSDHDVTSTKVKFETALDILEDCNFSSYRAYLNALWNINHTDHKI